MARIKYVFYSEDGPYGTMYRVDNHGTDGDDAIYGGSGNALIKGRGGDDWIDAGCGDDRVFGGAGDDIIIHDGGVGRLFGGAGNDDIMGYGDGTYVKGGIGDDTIAGSDGRFEGNKGDDQFSFNLWQDGNNVVANGGGGRDAFSVFVNIQGADYTQYGPSSAKIEDFQVGVDKLELDSHLTNQSIHITRATTFDTLDTDDNHFLNDADAATWLGDVVATATGIDIFVGLSRIELVGVAQLAATDFVL